MKHYIDRLRDANVDTLVKMIERQENEIAIMKRDLAIMEQVLKEKIDQGKAAKVKGQETT